MFESRTLDPATLHPAESLMKQIHRRAAEWDQAIMNGQSTDQVSLSRRQKIAEIRQMLAELARLVDTKTKPLAEKAAALRAKHRVRIDRAAVAGYGREVESYINTARGLADLRNRYNASTDPNERRAWEERRDMIAAKFSRDMGAGSFVAQLTTNLEADPPDVAEVQQQLDAETFQARRAANLVRQYAGGGVLGGGDNELLAWADSVHPAQHLGLVTEERPIF